MELGAFRTAPIYRVFSIYDIHPGMFQVNEGGVSVAGELYRVPQDVLQRVEAGEPPHLYRGPVLIEDGRLVQGIHYPQGLANGKHRGMCQYDDSRAYPRQRVELSYKVLATNIAPGICGDLYEDSQKCWISRIAGLTVPWP